MMLKSKVKKGLITILLLTLASWATITNVLAQKDVSVLYVPLIGITSVPEPLALPNDGGYVTYRYAVKNFLSEVPLTDIQIVDDKCNPTKFVTGDDNGNSMLDYSETWRYRCTTKLVQSTQSIATVTGRSGNITASHKAYTSVVVGLLNPAPLVSIVNTTKVAYPLSLPANGAQITYTYKVNNPGIVPLGNVIVTDDKCSAMSGKLGDTNGNNLLDINEVWIYTCMMKLMQTTTSTVSVTAFANGLKAFDYSTLTVSVDRESASSSPLFDVAISPIGNVTNDFKLIVWGILSGILIALVLLLFLNRNKRLGISKKYIKFGR